jgi:hypothetical protein
MRGLTKAYDKPDRPAIRREQSVHMADLVAGAE